MLGRNANRNVIEAVKTGFLMVAVMLGCFLAIYASIAINYHTGIDQEIALIGILFTLVALFWTAFWIWSLIKTLRSK